ncbi:MAG: DUF2461 domain-containing protein [Muribaculaceae bacterium]|nr:DUF2461 domain-containing protein [Muribaculaceae bacterium]
MKKILKFLKSLSENNNRDWFNEHKDEYLRIKSDIEQLTQRLINEVAAFDPEAAYLTPADCTYRIYRDTRFSSDKTPYKTHIGIFINPPMGKKSNRMGYYLHIEPGKSLVAVGTVCLPSKIVTAIRKSIFENVDEYLEIINEPEFKEFFPEIGENKVKTAPKGFSKDWSYIDLVRPRDFCASHYLSDEEMCSSELVEKVGKLFRVSKPFNDFINYTIDEVGVD